MSTPHRKIILAAGLCVLVLIAGVRLWPPSEKTGTSFLLIVVDSMRADHLGTYGYPRATSPRIDALAENGIVFTNAISQAPWTKPSVASLFTSTYTSVHRVLYSKQMIDGEERSDILNAKFETMAEAFRSGGFATGGFGMKIHLRPPFGFDQGFEGYNMHARRAEKINRHALSWLRSAGADRFFMYIHYNDPHYPYNPRAGYGRFGTTRPRVQINGDTKRAFRGGVLELSQNDIRQLVDLYDGEILYTDKYLGELIDSIESMGYSNLFVIVTADHGEEFLEHGDITHGQSLYSELVRVPLIVSGSALPPGSRGIRSDDAVQLIDLMPTMLDLAGLPHPAGLQGISFSSILEQGASELPREAIFTERREIEDPGFSEAVTDGRWKLIRDAVAGRNMLYDLKADPGETIRLEDRNQGIVDEFISRLDAWVARNTSMHEQLLPEDTMPLDPETEQRLKSLGYVN